MRRPPPRRRRHTQTAVKPLSRPIEQWQQFKQADLKSLNEQLERDALRGDSISIHARPIIGLKIRSRWATRIDRVQISNRVVDRPLQSD